MYRRWRSTTFQEASIISIVLILFAIRVTVSDVVITFDPQDLAIMLHDHGSFSIKLSEPLNDSQILVIENDNEGIVEINSTIELASNVSTFDVNFIGTKVGHVVVNGNASYFDIQDAFIRIKVKYQDYLDVLSDVVGWIYFAAWTISFYPQIYINFRRKSVIGLNFDYVALNIVGFVSYSLFNAGLYFFDSIQDQYFEKYPRGVLPVRLNDVVFALHAVFATIVIIIQALIYERAKQRVSYVCVGILIAAGVFLFISLILSITDVITWLSYLYYFSYVKLAITIIKYVPQAYFNFRRKSTKGWSIGNVLLDFTGGVLSILQMFILAYNYNDWSSIFGDPTKFGLGLFSALFDILFVIQHYCLYRNTGIAFVTESEEKIISSVIHAVD